MNLTLRAGKQTLRRNAQPRLTIATDELRNHIADSLDAGALPIQSDTEALAKSLSVRTPEGSDGDARIRQAATAYLSKDNSRWIGPVRQFVTPMAYEKAHWAERVADDVRLPRLDKRPRTMLYTRVAYGLWWYAGHSNVFTGRYEERDWIHMPALDWSRANLPGYFVGTV